MQQNKCQKPPQSSGALAATATTLGACFFLVGPVAGEVCVGRGERKKDKEQKKEGEDARGEGEGDSSIQQTPNCILSSS